MKEHHYFRTLFFMTLLIIILIIVYGLFLGNSGLIIKDYKIKYNNMPDSFNNLKIVHFADILYDSKDDIEQFDELVKKINDKKPDIVIFTGNLTKNRYTFKEKEIEKITNYLTSINTTYGKYYISGKNDKKNESYESIMDGSGFINLNDNSDIIFSKTKDKLLLVGLDYNSSTSFIDSIISDNSITYKIAIFSESDKIDEIKDYNFNLALASNSLNGQINIPYVKQYVKRDGSEKYINNYYKVNNTKLYVNSGIGTDQIDFRLFNRPCINVYTIKK